MRKIRPKWQEGIVVKRIGGDGQPVLVKYVISRQWFMGVTLEEGDDGFRNHLLGFKKQHFELYALPPRKKTHG